MEAEVSARAWIVMDVEKKCYLRGLNIEHRMESASLTKMYTLYACLLLNNALAIDPDCQAIHIFDTCLSGTSAKLKTGALVWLRDLYYAMMLPSGNDAAFLLACYYGFWLGR